MEFAPMDAVQGIWFWSIINAVLTSGVLIYVVKTENRLATLETTVRLMLNGKGAAHG